MKFLGAPYPIKKTALGLLPTQTGLDQVKADLLILLMTNPGERVMLPEYGTGLNSLLFQQNDEEIVEKAREMIANAISIWEPRIVIKDIEVNIGSLSYSTDDMHHALHIKIDFFDQDKIQEVQELVLKVPLGANNE